jgi:hypothetical protein
MKIEFDSEKDAANLEKHGVSLGLAACLDENNAVIFVDERKDYGETRYIAMTPLPTLLENRPSSVRLHIIVYTRLADGIRVISLRKANKREEKIYAQEIAH